MMTTRTHKVSKRGNPIAFKVFYATGTGPLLMSMSSNPNFILDYEQGVMTRAPGNTKLFVFRDMDYAKDFAGGGLTEVWEVECSPDLERAKRIIEGRMFPGFSEEKVFYFWETVSDQEYVPSFLNTLSLPLPYTLLCKWVVPIKKIPKDG